MNWMLIGMWIGIGSLAGLILAPFGIFIWSKYKETKIRNKIKIMIDEKKMLIPLDKKDYNTEMWKTHIGKDDEKILKSLDKKIFDRDKVINVDTNDAEVINEKQ